MSVKCIDLSEDNSLKEASPIPMVAFSFCFFIINIFLPFDMLYIIVSIITFGICLVVFQYSPRIVFLTYRFLTRHSDLSPNFQDKSYVPNELINKNIEKIIKK
jgi:hypothetical protein